jgi:hypothetical protein
MTSKSFFRFALSAVMAVVIHIILVIAGLFNISILAAVVADIILLGVFLGGVAAIRTMERKLDLSFVQLFLILTTVQMLTCMVILLCIVYLKLPESRSHALQQVTLFIILLALQSIALIQWVRGK